MARVIQNCTHFRNLSKLCRTNAKRNVYCLANSFINSRNVRIEVLVISHSQHQVYPWKKPNSGYICFSNCYSTDNVSHENSNLSEAQYESLAEETLVSLSDMFDDIGEDIQCDPEYDVSLKDGVLTVKISDSWGTYVINKQAINKQIWLSSPLSGPFRYDFIANKWIYKRDGSSLHELLSRELSTALGHKIDFTSCKFGGSEIG